MVPGGDCAVVAWPTIWSGEVWRVSPVPAAIVFRLILTVTEPLQFPPNPDRTHWIGVNETSVIPAPGPGDDWLKVAVTDRFLSMRTVQPKEPVQSPDQPANVDPDAAVCVTVTV